jgi:hypothetical protein
MGNFDPVPYTSLVADPNTFGRPRQKVWGVFIISGYSESDGALVPINYTSGDHMKSTKTFATATKGPLNHYDIKNFDPNATIPATGPENEVIQSKKLVSILKDGAVSTGTRQIYMGSWAGWKTYDLYAETDVIATEVELKYYFAKVKTIAWDLVLLTRDQNEAKAKLNQWLREPEISTTRPLVGIDSVMICEIIPADSIIEL